MRNRVRALVVFGTRPEAIKLAPVIERLRERHEQFETLVAVTAQHREMLDQVLGVFGIAPDFDLDIMTVGQSLTDINVRALGGLSPLVARVRPDIMIVQGDTTTTFAAALSAFYHHVPVGHVEAGLRTQDLEQPYPEEANRRLTTQIAKWHFAPTSVAEANLLREGVEPQSITVTGNTVVDALIQTAQRPYDFGPGKISDVLASGRRIVLVTAHRRENWGAPMESICSAVGRLADRFDDVEILFATHGNPACADIASEALGGQERVHLIGPQEYLPFVKLMQASTLVLTDSGGMQEEAPTLGKPALVMRDITERPEAVQAGVVKLVGTDADNIVAEASVLLSDAGAYDAMAKRANPFGDGHAAERIVEVLTASAGA
ncbi:MAG: UDP-N-acetylglucosamine 2-epimerase (non-hydrolyzing) [Coriobacteriia bacterium]|nr:UDP-N-acetylglucosamine 2-epimerase (non-hydrolyzing) [Coriobacteriia bacterium]